MTGYKKFAGWIVFFIAVLLVRTFIFSFAVVVGSSMEPTFTDDDFLISVCNTNKLERYDVVTAKVDDMTVIKRIVGMPGDTIQVRDGVVYINGRELTGEFAFYTADAGVTFDGYTVAADEYFLMGDNRSESRDSRDFGGVSQENIRGVVIFRLYPFDVFGRI